MTRIKTNLTRRAALKFCAGFAAAGSLAGRAIAQTASSGSDYKALICVFMSGGNDGHNLLIPQTGPGYAAYKAARGSLALPDGTAKLLPVTAKDGTPYALNDGLSAIHPLWASGQLAVLANVGVLVQPTTRAQYLANSVPLPSNLFSHSDQVVAMQAGNPYGSGGTGWGGRLADATRSLNGQSHFPSSISMAGNALYTTGAVVPAASLVPGFDLTPDGFSAWPASASAARSAAFQQILTLDSGVSLIQAANQIGQDAVSLNTMLKAANAGAQLKTVFPGTELGKQMRQIAQIINLRAATGMTRQVFFVNMGGFDTHSGQSWQQWDNFKQIAGAMRALYDASVEMGVDQGITQFTLSDFGRTLQPNNTGTDHGWGNHHLILGGAVKGGTVFGTFPSHILGGADDATGRGAMIPTTSIDQYGASLARWFGLDAPSLATAFPNLTHFPVTDLGIMGG